MEKITRVYNDFIEEDRFSKIISNDVINDDNNGNLSVSFM